jgi:pumilio RNA-binding family
VGLSGDAFGNYVIQHALDYGRPIDRDRIVVCLASLDIVALCCCKFASNVVEKAIRNHNKLSLTSPSSILVTRLLIGSLLNGAEEPAIMTLMKDRYGNYVVRAIVELTNPEFNSEVSRVTTMILGNAASLKKFTFSWHLVEKLGKRNHGL